MYPHYKKVYYNKQNDSLNMFGINIYLTPIVEGVFDIYPEKEFACMAYGMIPKKIFDIVLKHLKNKFHEYAKVHRQELEDFKNDPTVFKDIKKFEKVKNFFEEVLNENEKVWMLNCERYLAKTFLRVGDKKMIINGWGD